MSCAVMIAAALLAAEPAAAAAAAAAPTQSEAEAPVAREALFMHIVSRSRMLKGIVDGWIAEGFQPGAFPAFRAEAEDLAAMNMRGHVTLHERNLAGDLKCILRGISEDMPGRLDAVQDAPDEAERRVALSELSHLLDDNAAVILAPPQPGS